MLQDQVSGLLGNSASAVMTNVPGPQKPLYFAGKRIEALEFWVPQSGGIGMGVSILSYDGRIQFGVITDAGLVPDPHRIVDRFGDEFDKLLWLTLMSPWGPAVDAQAAAEAGPDPPAQAAVPQSSGTQSRNPKSKAPAIKIPKRFRNL